MRTKVAVAIGLLLVLSVSISALFLQPRLGNIFPQSLQASDFLRQWYNVSLVLSTQSAFAAKGPVQAPINFYIDIWTNKGGEGLYQYGGSYNIGETITIFITSRTGGYAEVTLCYQSLGENCHEYDSGYIAPQDRVDLPGSVGPPSGKQYFNLSVCQSPGGSSNCPYDYIWIDVNS